MELTKEVLDIYKKKKYAVNTISTYSYSLKEIFHNAIGTNELDMNKLKTHETQILQYIHSLLQIRRQRELLCAILSLVETQSYKDALRDVKIKYGREYQYRKPKEHYTLQKLYQSICKLKLTDYRDRIKYILASLYIYLPPLRHQDYRNLIVINNKPEATTHIDYFDELKHNYIDIIDWKIVIGNFKTNKLYPTRVINIPNDLREVLAYWIDIEQINPNEYLLQNKFRQQFSQQLLSMTIKKIFSVSMGTLRRIYISEMVQYLMESLEHDEAIHWRNNLAQMVGHALSTQEMIYSSNKFHEDRSEGTFMTRVFNHLKEAYIK